MVLVMTAGVAMAWSPLVRETPITNIALRAQGPLMEHAIADVGAMFRPVSASRLDGTGKPTVWTEFGQLAAETKAVNLGQGFPDWQPPTFVVEEAHNALIAGYHQYTRPAGHPELVEVLAKRYSNHFQRSVNPLTEVCITIGASQALYLTLQVESSLSRPLKHERPS